MNTEERPSWIVAHDGTGKNAYAVECLRCGAIQRFATPIAISVWIAAARAFERMHRECKERSTTKAQGREP